jgi:hypothetical protein
MRPRRETVMAMHKDETKILITIGHMCRQWSYLEYLLANIIWHLLKIDRNTGAIVTASFDIKNLARVAVEYQSRRTPTRA